MVLGISGTPRKDGNSEILLQHALQPFERAGWNIEVLRLRGIKVGPCTGCDTCAHSGVCRFKDGMDLFYEAYRRCHAIIISSPVYWRNVPGQLKCVMDRTYAVRRLRPLAGKPGGAISVGRGETGGQALALTVLHNFLLSAGVVCVPGELNGVSATADNPGDILQDEKKLKQAAILGKNIMDLAVKL
jgi:multimeric flavodoxin WrbA